jgi:hypothetical protein
MMTPAVYDLNNFLKNHPDVQEIAGTSLDFYPIVGYGEENPPFVVYIANPNIPSLEAFWNRYDVITYTIYDSNIDRLFKITEKFLDLLAKGDEISQPGGADGTSVRILSTYFVDSDLEEAMEKDGWFKMTLNFILYYVII